MGERLQPLAATVPSSLPPVSLQPKIHRINRPLQTLVLICTGVSGLDNDGTIRVRALHDCPGIGI
jgi:hypothetical protein